MGHNGAEIQRGRDGAVRIRSPYDQGCQNGQKGSVNVATIVATDRGGMLCARIYDLASANNQSQQRFRLVRMKMATT